MAKFFTHASHKYSVDMMLAYVNLFPMPSTDIPVSELAIQLTDPRWYSTNDKVVSVVDVLKSPSRHKEHYDRIINADLACPIIIRKSGHLIVDGLHRVAKAQMIKQEMIPAYVFEAGLMKKFEMFTLKDIFDIDGFELIELFCHRFHKDVKSKDSSQMETSAIKENSEKNSLVKLASKKEQTLNPKPKKRERSKTNSKSPRKRTRPKKDSGK